MDVYEKFKKHLETNSKKQVKTDVINIFMLQNNLCGYCVREALEDIYDASLKEGEKK